MSTSVQEITNLKLCKYLQRQELFPSYYHCSYRYDYPHSDCPYDSGTNGECNHECYSYQLIDTENN
jgi:hypothetical protein